MAPDHASEVPLLPSPRFLGRAAETGELVQALHRARSGKGEAWLLTGPEGIGKSRLAQWVEDEAKQEGFHLCRGTAEREESLPFHLWDKACETSGRPTAIPSAGAPDAVRTPSARMMGYLARLARLATDQPVLVVLDDLQWADPASLRTFQFLVRNSRGLPILFLGCQRTGPSAAPPLASAESALEELTSQMEREGNLHLLRLKGFTPAEVMDLLRGATELPLDLEAGDGAFRRFLLKTEGNPNFALSALRLVWEQGRVLRREDRAIVGPGAPVGQGETELPTDLQRTLRERLDLLAPEEMHVLACASLLGRDFELSPLQAILGRSREELRALARRLEALHGVVRPIFGGSDRWTFSEASIVDLARSRLSETEHRALARQLGDWWSSHRGDDVEQVARLYFEARESALARPWIFRAIERALDQESAEPVETYLGWTRELLGGDRVQLVARAVDDVRVARGLRRFGANGAALRLLRPLEELELGSEIARERDLAIVDVLSDLDVTEASSRLTRLEAAVAAAAPGSVPALFRARLAGTRAYISRVTGAFEAGITAAQKALDILELEPDPRETARNLYEAGWCALELERWEEAERYFREQLAVGRREGLARSEASALSGLGGVAFLVGRIQEAQRHFEGAVAIQRAGGELQRAVPLLFNLSIIALAQGDQNRAWALHDEASSLSSKFDLPRWVAAGEGHRADLLAWERQWKEAEAAYLSGLERFGSIGGRVNQIAIDIGLAWVRGEAGDPTGSLAALAKMGEDPTELPAQHADFYYEVRARMKELSNDADGAKRDLEVALGRTGPSLHRRAKLLGDLSAWEVEHGDESRALDLRSQADVLYRKAGVDPERARLLNEVFLGATVPRPDTGSKRPTG